MMKKLNKEQIISKISKYNYVSFDVFDTLIKRNLYSPTDVYKYIEEEYNFENFASDRSKAELLLWNKDNQKYFTYDNIYNDNNLLCKYDIESIKKIEIESELNFSIKNFLFDEVYKYCIQNNKKIILISDIYLDRKVMEKILEKNNISNYYKLYISSEIGMTKNTGDLFEYVLNDLKISSKEIFHIGDSFKSDYYKPRTKGIKSYKINTKYNNLNYQLYKRYFSLSENFLSNFLNNNITKYSNLYEKIGYETLGTLLIGFLKWVNQECKKNNCEKILFIARDGYIMKKCYDIMEKDNNSAYFYASRRSVTVPLLENVQSFSDIKKIIKFRKNETISDILKKIGIDDQIIIDPEISKINIIRDKNNDILNEVIINNLDVIHKNAKKEKVEFQKYFKSLVNDSKKIALVDLGWHGSIQDSIEKIFFDEDFSFNGFYLGLIDDKNISRKKAYAFDSKSEKFNPNLVSAYRGIIESIFTASHGSTIKYNDAQPILDIQSKNENGIDIIEMIHNGAVNFFKDYYNNSIDFLSYDSNYCFEPLYNLMVKPDLKTLNLMKSINFCDTRNRSIVPNKSLLYYIFHISKFKKDFVDSDWKIAFLKYEFKLFNNYGKILGILLKLRRVSK